jgi:nicotinamidase-related amidase
MRAELAACRDAGIPVVYVNDQEGRWRWDVGELLDAAAAGPGADVAAALAPAPEEPVLPKPRYSAFDHTPVELLLRELGCERLLLAGATTEGCVVQTGIDARELGYKVTILTGACATIDPRLERVALAYAEEIGGIRLARGVTEALGG